MMRARMGQKRCDATAMVEATFYWSIIIVLRPNDKLCRTFSTAVKFSDIKFCKVRIHFRSLQLCKAQQEQLEAANICETLDVKMKFIAISILGKEKTSDQLYKDISGHAFKPKNASGSYLSKYTNRPPLFISHGHEQTCIYCQFYAVCSVASPISVSFIIRLANYDTLSLYDCRFSISFSICKSRQQTKCRWDCNKTCRIQHSQFCTSFVVLYAISHFNCAFIFLNYSFFDMPQALLLTAVCAPISMTSFTPTIASSPRHVSVLTSATRNVTSESHLCFCSDTPLPPQWYSLPNSHLNSHPPSYLRFSSRLMYSAPPFLTKTLLLS